MRIMLANVGLMIVCLIMASLSFALDPASVTDGHVYLLDNISGTEVPDDSANDHVAAVIGDPQVVAGLSGKALLFDGVDDGVHIPDSAMINATSGPWSNRTVMAVFNCADASKQEKQTIYEEGGTTRGLNIYVFDGEVYVGGWNKDANQVDWNPGTWLSAPIGSNEWHAVAFVLRGGTDTVEAGKFEMWLDGRLVTAGEGSNIYNHTADNSIGYTKGDTVFHDTGNRSEDGDFFAGMVDELWIINEALSAADFRSAMLSVEHTGKLTAAWGALKTCR